MRQKFASRYLQGSPRSMPSQRAYQDGKGYGGLGSGLLLLQERSETGGVGVSGVPSVSRGFPLALSLVEM